MTLSLRKIWPFLVIIGLTLIIFAPIFNLALTGDDYLGMWRYQLYLEFGPNHQDWNIFKFLFTDYGPQDSLFVLIHHFFGFNDRVYYIFNFIFRMLAAWSIYLLTSRLTHNRFASLVGMAFFAITATGLETTNWSFNMPSYIAIFFMNLFVTFRLALSEQFKVKNLVLILALFTLSILSQPIRMTFMPILAIWLEILIFMTKSPRPTRQLALIPIYILIFGAIILFGFIGNSVGAGETFQARIIDQGWTKLVGNNLSNVTTKLADGQYQVLFYPIAQIGNIIFPNQLYPLSSDPRASQGGKLSLALLTLIVGLIVTSTFWWKRLPQPMIIGLSLLSLAWTILVWIALIWQTPYPITTNELASFLIGGQFLIICGLLFLPFLKNRNLMSSLIFGLSLMTLGFITPWLRNPTFLFETTGRYLIVPAVGLSLLVGLTASLIRQARRPIILAGLIISLFALHIFTANSYLTDLMRHRNITKAEANRNAIYYAPGFNNPDEPMIYYFEPKDSREIYHTLMFGFPLFIGYHYNIQQIWHIAYTDNWSELQSAYLDGSSLKRFSIPVKPVKLENIYSFKLDNGQLVDTTSQTRTKLETLHENH